MAGKEIWDASDWYWSVDRSIVQTVIDKTAGTVTVNLNSTTVTGASTAFASSDVGSYIQFSSNSDWYKITAFSSTTSITIESNFTGTAALSAGTYTIRKFFYLFASTADKILTARQSISPSFLTVKHYREFDIYKPDPTSTSNPLVMVVYGVDSAGTLQFTPWPWPDAVENIEVRFKKRYVDLSADSDTAIIPAKYHETVMIDGALYRGFQYLGVDHPQFPLLAASAYQRYRQGIKDMIVQNEPDTSYHLQIENRDADTSLLTPTLPYKYGV